MKNCEEITLDIERGHYKKLSVKELVTIKMHLIICKPCHNYKRDSEMIDKLLHEKYKNGAEEYKFSPEEKEAIKKACDCK